MAAKDGERGEGEGSRLVDAGRIGKALDERVVAAADAHGLAGARRLDGLRHRLVVCAHPASTCEEPCMSSRKHGNSNARSRGAMIQAINADGCC